MLFSAYMYALYQDKNRITPVEFFKQLKAKALGNTETTSTTTRPPTTPAMTTPGANGSGASDLSLPEPLSWANPEDRPYIVAAFIVFFFEFVLLYFAILMAIRVSKTRTQLFLNLFGAVFFTLPYILLNTIFQTEAYQSLNETSYVRPLSMSGRSGSSRYV